MSAETWFDWLAKRCARAAGQPAGFTLAVVVVLVWLITGPIFNYSDTWQLIINTGTTIVTFWMVFLVQSTQNRDTAAIHIKLDELIRAVQGAHNALLDLEELGEKDLTAIRGGYEKLAALARKEIREGKGDIGTPDVGQ